MALSIRAELGPNARFVLTAAAAGEPAPEIASAVTGTRFLVLVDTTSHIIARARLLAALAALAVLAPAAALGAPSFTEVTATAGVTHVYSDPSMIWGGGGVALADLDGDGHLDLLVAGGAELPLQAWRGLGDLAFEPVDLGLPNAGAEKALALADYDNDGDLDVYMAVPAGHARLYRNDGPFLFTDVTAEAGLPVEPESWGFDAQWGDVDGDLDLDLYAPRYDLWTNTGARLYLSNGDGTFTAAPDANGASGKDFSNTATPTKLVAGGALGTRLVDLDNDGDLDLFVANDRGYGGNAWFYVFANDGSGHFEDVTLDVMTPIQANGMGVAAADLDQDGFVDIYVTNTAAQHFHLDNDCGALTEVAKASGTAVYASGWGVVSEDFDQDSHVDLYVAQDVVAPPGWNALLHNQGDGTFVDVAPGTDAALGATDSMVAVGGDLDGDGDIDLVVLDQDGPMHVLRNDTVGTSRLTVRLVGTQSNRDGIGARVEALVGTTRQTRLIASTNAYLATGPLVAHFGLRDATQVDRLVVRWPSGVVQAVQDVPAGEVTVVEQSEGAALPLLTERCGNGQDDDCDGETDEGFGDAGSPCDAGACEGEATLACGLDGWLVCTPLGVPPDQPELCDNGQDDDCDGETDEGFEALGAPCTVTSPGACPSEGALVCAADGLALACDAPPVLLEPELCNGVDDDCDGATDEGFADKGATCTVRFGGMGPEISGRLECAADGASLTCVPDRALPLSAQPEEDARAPVTAEPGPDTAEPAPAADADAGPGAADSGVESKNPAKEREVGGCGAGRDGGGPAPVALVAVALWAAWLHGRRLAFCTRR